MVFSSVGSGLGNVGQANYASSNSWLDTQTLCLRARGMAGRSVQWPLVGGAGMGASAFAAVAECRVALTGMAGISLEQYAACIAAQLGSRCGMTLSVQLVHRSDVRELLQDLADATQARFCELREGSAPSAAARG